jgi:hypothetical protein
MQVDVRNGSRPRENSEIEFGNGNFVLTSIILKNKSAGDGCRDKTIEKTILRTFRARTFSRSLGQKRRFDHPPVASGLPRSADIRRVRRHVSKVPKPKVAASFDYLVGAAKRRGRNLEADSQIAIMAENTGATQKLVKRAKPLLEHKGFTVERRHSGTRSIIMVPPRG